MKVTELTDSLKVAEPDWKYLAARLYGGLKAAYLYLEDQEPQPARLAAFIRRTLTLYEQLEVPIFIDESRKKS